MRFHHPVLTSPGVGNVSLSIKSLWAFVKWRMDKRGVKSGAWYIVYAEGKSIELKVKQ